MGLGPEHRRFLALDQGLAPTVFNFLINGAIAWLVFGSLAAVPLWGQPSVGADTLGTAFILPLATALIVTRVVRGQVASGKIPPLKHVPAWLGRFAEKKPLWRGTALGLAAVVLTAAPALAVLEIAGLQTLELAPFLWFKATFAAVLAAVATPLLAYTALVPMPEVTAEPVSTSSASQR